MRVFNEFELPDILSTTIFTLFINLFSIFNGYFIAAKRDEFGTSSMSIFNTLLDFSFNWPFWPFGRLENDDDDGDDIAIVVEIGGERLPLDFTLDASTEVGRRSIKFSKSVGGELVLVPGSNFIGELNVLL